MKLFAKIAAAALLLIGSSQIARSADTFTPNCRIVQMPTGSNDTLWGTKANAAFAMLDQCISQGSIISVTGGNVTLTTANNAADQARSAIIAFTGTPGVTRTITMPNVSKLTWVANSSNASLIFTAGAGTTATVISGATGLIYTDAATNAVALMNVASSAQAILAAGLGSAASQPASAFMAGANNGSEFTNMATVRSNIGLGGAAVLNTFNSQTNPVATQIDGVNGRFALFNASGAIQSSAYNESTFAVRANNLSDLTSVSTARTNLGLGNAATRNTSGGGGGAPVSLVASAVAGEMAYFSDNTGLLAASGVQISNILTGSGNLAGVSNAATARSNLGLGNLGTQSTKNITVSNSGPSGSANDGDVWLKW